MSARGADAADAAAVIARVRAAIRTSAAEHYTASQIEAWASGWGSEGVDDLLRDTIAFVAESEGQLVGLANLDGCEIGQLFVHPSVGGRGIARDLYGAVEGVARQRGIERVSAFASLRSAPVFARFGFVHDAVVTREFNGESFDVVLVSKPLNPHR